ncbi:MAG: ester cyclase [Acidimicrobiales bacterium]
MPEDNDTIVARFEQAFIANDVDTIDELCDPGLVDRNPLPGQEPTLAGFKSTIAMYHEKFSGLSLDLAAVVGEGDQVATRWNVTGTHASEFFGVPATGKQISAEGMNFYRLAEGRITEVWTQFDALGLLQQLGALPS